MNLTIQQGYPDNIGRKEAFVGYGTGPASYSQTTGDPLAQFAFQKFYDAVDTAVSVSGTYYARAVPDGAGPRQNWKLKWYVTATNAEVANGVNLSAETMTVFGFCSRY